MKLNNTLNHENQFNTFKQKNNQKVIPKLIKQSSQKYNSGIENNNIIRFFSSFTEMNEFDYCSRATLTPEEDLSHVTHMRLAQHSHPNIELIQCGNKNFLN